MKLKLIIIMIFIYIYKKKCTKKIKQLIKCDNHKFFGIREHYR